MKKSDKLINSSKVFLLVYNTYIIDIKQRVKNLMGYMKNKKTYIVFSNLI